MSLKNIAIVGAGGQMGAHISEALLKTGKFSVTALTRVGSENKVPAGVKTAQITYDDHASIVKALKDQDALIITLSVTTPPDTTEKLAKACAEANVKWIMPNEWGTNSEAGGTSSLFPQKLKDHEIIQNLGMNWIGVACSFWYEFSLGGTSDRYGFDFPNKTVIFFDDGERKINTSTWVQTGRCVAALLSLPIQSTDGSPSLEGYRNKFVNVSSFKVSQKDMFASVLRVSGDKESDWTISYEPVEERIANAKAELASGNPRAFGKFLYAMGFLPDALDFDKSGGLANKALGLPEEDFDAATKYGIEIGMSDYMEKKYANITRSK